MIPTRPNPFQCLLPCLLMMLAACQDTGRSDFAVRSRAFSIDPGLDVVLTLESGSSLVEMLQGQHKNITTSLNVVNESGISIQVRNEVLIEPADGITLKSDFPAGGQVTSGSVSYVMNQVISGLRPGVYRVTNRAFIPGSQLEASETVSVHVLPPGGSPTVLPLGAWPDGVPVQSSTEVTFTAAIANFRSRPNHLDLHRVDGSSNPLVGTLHDDGTQGDLLAGDGVYSARLTVHSAEPGSLRYVATATFPGLEGERLSPVFDLLVSRHPTTPRPALKDKAVTDADGEVSFLCNEVLVSFAEGVTPDEKDAIIAERTGGSIVGGLPGLGILQVELPGPCTAATVQEAIGRLREDPRLRSATPNFLGEADGYTPSDPQYATQYGLGRIRADEAWILARGSGVLVAVVDTGIHYNHEDLSGQVIKGRDFPQADDDPLDDIGHGTGVASIIAARSDNAVGLASVAWNSKLLAIRVIDGDGAMTLSDGAAAIKSAADQGAKVINCSWGFWDGTRPIDTTALAAAVRYAAEKGALVVAAAGNMGNERLRFPCAYPEALCVGATTASDGRWGLSNRGGHVDMAAPGANVTVALLNGGYGTAQGTSHAAAFISASAAVVWSYFPSWTASQVRQRLERTASPLEGLGLGSGRVDLFEAVFNGSFEDDINGWSAMGTAGAFRSLGPLLPQNRDKMAVVSSGPDAAQIQTTLEQAFTIQAGVTTLPLRFDYNFVTEEYPEWVGSSYNDNIRITLLAPNGTETTLAYEEVNSSYFTSVTGVDFPGGDNTVGSTGWKTAIVRIPVSSGPGRYRVRVRDEGDGIYDSNLLIDNIRFK